MINLADIIEPGARAERTITVTHELTVQHAYPQLPAVYATPQLIMLMEIAAADAILPMLPDGWGSVGTLVDVRHLAATRVGDVVVANATVVEVFEKTVRFECTAHDSSEQIGSGFHERAPIDIARFVKRVENKPTAKS